MPVRPTALPAALPPRRRRGLRVAGGEGGLHPGGGDQARDRPERRDGRREEFSKEKLISGLKKACQKRPISPKVIEDLVEKIVDEISDKYEREVPGMAIGERVMEGLREIDKVAYVRFASVYRRFEEATEFVREVKNLEANHDST